MCLSVYWYIYVGVSVAVHTCYGICVYDLLDPKGVKLQDILMLLIVMYNKFVPYSDAARCVSVLGNVFVFRLWTKFVWTIFCQNLLLCYL